MNRSFEYQFFRYFQNLRQQLMARPLVLGGVRGANGGTGGPPGGFVGYLPQTRVAYDTTEAATDYIPESGLSLVDNLNHIRYRTQILESSWSGYSPSASISVYDDSVLIANNITSLNFGDNLDVVDNGSGYVTINSSGTGSGHNPVTLDSDIDNVITITDQELGLQNQSANNFFAGPASGVASKPLFRPIAIEDLGTGTPDGTKYLRDDLTWYTPPGTSGSSGITWQRTVVVDQAGNGNYTTIAAAIAFVNSQTRDITHQWSILLTGGYYGPDYPSFTIPTYTHIMSFHTPVGTTTSATVWLDMEHVTSGYAITIPQYSSLSGVLTDVSQTSALTGDHGAIALNGNTLYNSLKDVQIRYRVSLPMTYIAAAVRDITATASITYFTNVNIDSDQYGIYSSKASSWFSGYNLTVWSSTTAIYLSGTFILYNGSSIEGTSKSIDGTGSVTIQAGAGIWPFAEETISTEYYDGSDAAAIQDIAIERVYPAGGDTLQYNEDEDLWKFVPLPSGLWAGTKLDDLSDVDVGSATTAQILEFDGSKWVPVDVSFFSSVDLDDLRDVVITTPVSGEILAFDGSNWINITSSGIGGPTVLDGLTDVNVPAPVSGEVLTFDGSQWVSRTLPSYSDISQALFYFYSTLTTGASLLQIPNATGESKTISKVYLRVATAPTGSTIIVDIHKNGTTIFTTQSNRPVISIGNNTGSSSTIDVPTWADGEYIEAYIDQIGSTVAGANLVVVVVYS